MGPRKDAVARHRAHIETAMVEAKKADDARDTDELLDELAELVRDARRLGEKAEAIGDCKGRRTRGEQVSPNKSS